MEKRMLRIVLGNQAAEDFGQFRCLMTEHAYCTIKFRLRITMAKSTFAKKRSL